CAAAQNTAAKPAASKTVLSDKPVDSCNACVMERIGPAQAYVPSQSYTAPMEQEQSLVCGTVFSELVMPYCKGWNLYRFSKEV
ncbi:MAG: spore coat associated protein CotJA, partial [Anaerotignum sp.]|nr:spore coat associated protein CotJA [Anaerotignum sp.]